jgi:hypothetical protein
MQRFLKRVKAKTFGNEDKLSDIIDAAEQKLNLYLDDSFLTDYEVIKGKCEKRDSILLFEEYIVRLIKSGAEYNIFQLLNFNIKLSKEKIFLPSDITA